MTRKGSSSRSNTILYWLGIVILFGVFLGNLSAYFTQKEGGDNVSSEISLPNHRTKHTSQTKDASLLGDEVLPTHYRLEVKSDHVKDQFSGTVAIDIDIKQELDQLKLHCKNLEIRDYHLKDSDGASVHFKNVEIDPRLEFCVFIPNKSIPPKNYTLTIKYAGKFVPGQTVGFYKSNYTTTTLDIVNNTTTNNQTVGLLTATKFEPTYARMAFPCFDEPRFMTKFNISIVHLSALKALSNEMEESTVPLDDDEAGCWSKTTFKQTAPMSTYLVAFIVMDFKYTEMATTFGTRIRVYSRSDQVGKTRYALETAAQVLQYYQEYTSIPYALTKLDVLALPEFAPGAMATWGLVTYKETLVLHSDNESSVFDMMRIASAISHELAHMWFGDLGTLKLRNGHWLNEAFVRYFEYKFLNQRNKTWSHLDLILTNEINPANSQQSSCSLVTDSCHPMFDTVIYSKGASILNMLESIIGPDAFQTCTRNYLKDYQQFGKVDTTDKIIKHFKDEIKKVTSIEGVVYLAKYLHSDSYPILSVERDTQLNDTLKITQMASNSNQSSVLEEPWMVHVSYLLPNNRNGSFVLSQVSQTVQLDTSLAPNEWIKLNRNSNGFYIVNYQPNDWKLLISQLKQEPSAIPKRDRANILFDAYLLSDKGLLEYETLFDLFDYLKNEYYYLPWSAASSTLSLIQSQFTSTSSSSTEQFKAYVHGLFDNIYKYVTLETSSITQSSRVRNLAELACLVEYPKCLEKTSLLFRNWLENGTSVNRNFRCQVYKYGLQASKNDTDWARVWYLYRSEKDALEKSKLLSALAGTTSSNMLLKLITYSRNQSLIDNDSFFSIHLGIASNSAVGRVLVWDYIRNNWPILVSRFGLADRRLGNYVSFVTAGFATTSRLNEIQNFFVRNPLTGAGAALESVKKNIRWSKENLPKISVALNALDKRVNPWLNKRLDATSVRPTQYELNLTIDLDKEQFSGSVAIQVDVQRPIKHLIVHSSDLSINSSNLYTKKEMKLVSQANTGFAYLPHQLWVIPMNHTVSPGKYIAAFIFSGKIGTITTGIYLSQYLNSDTNQTVKLASTQFIAGHARKTFPCFDEPSFRASFTISITHSGKLAAISNMPVDYIRLDQNNMHTTVFRPSGPLSTHLVVFVVGDFSSKRSNLSTYFSVHSPNPKSNLAKAEYALNIGPKILDYYAKDYFKLAYPHPKTDMISMPEFSLGAHENWGPGIYRDVHLLYDEKETSSANKMSICSTIAHKLAHAWFGTLVTTKWWNELWLNEAFAQFMAYKATAAVEPSWNYAEHFVMNDLSQVYEHESFIKTRSIQTAVVQQHDDTAMQSLVDPAVYAEGTSAIRMLENIIGEDNFRQAVTDYLNKFAYNNNNIVTGDLWSEFTNVITVPKLNISSIMDTWIWRAGFPVVTVFMLNEDTFSFEQYRFQKFFDYTQASNTWFIPLTYR